MERSMYSFEGQFRRRPQQSLGGASKKLERNELLHQALLERQQREDKRKQHAAAICIQSWYRGSLVRKSQCEIHRVLFDELSRGLDSKAVSTNPEILGDLIKLLSFFYHEEKDAKRLNLLTQFCVQMSQTLTGIVVEKPSYWVPKLQKMCIFNIRVLQHVVLTSASIAMPLRFLEIFTCKDSYLAHLQEQTSLPKKAFIEDKYLYEQKVKSEILNKLWFALMKHGYFATLRSVLDHRVPSSLITSHVPPTPLAALLLDFLFRPLCVLEDPFPVKAMLSEVFHHAFTPQIHSFLLPAFAEHSKMVDINLFLRSLLIGDLKPCFVSSPWVMYTIIYVMAHRIGSMTQAQIIQYLEILRYLFICFRQTSGSEINGNADSDEEQVAHPENQPASFDLIKETINIVNDAEHVNMLMSAFRDEESFKAAVVPLCYFAYFLLDQHKLSIYNYRLLYTLAFKPLFLRELWNSILSSCTSSVFGASVPLLQYLSQGMTLCLEEQEKFIPQLTLFCALLNHFLSTLHDFEFYGDRNDSTINAQPLPFSLKEIATISLILRDVCMGLINLAYPETRPYFNEDYLKAMQSVGAVTSRKNNINIKDVKIWNQLFKYVVVLLRHLYSRDSRRRFCPEGQWIAKNFAISLNRAAELSNRKHFGYEPFVGLHSLSREELEEEGPPPSALEVRQIAVLQEFPFVIPFHERVEIFQSLITKDKSKNQGELVNFRMGPQIHVLIRRNFIYEDAFDNLSAENEPNLKQKVIVQLVNAVGLDEVGIDGGGIFREFLNELLKTCFDPNRGFFKTTHDCLLYPNPGVHRLIPDFTKHYYFIGRMLGKAIYENMLVELPFAEFFLAKILARHSSDVDIHHLASLDPVIYKNLLYLKTYEGDISDLGLDFTVLNSELGENEVIELRPGGANIPVTENNRINYIHLMADYKLNKQIKAQCQAFKEGLANVIDLEWLYMFDPNELQILISGAQIPIDIGDLKKHTYYVGGYYSDHPVILTFWSVVESFDERRRRQLLKFVTSCSRPPLLGFKELNPPFCIQNAGQEPNRLPTASTCMNLLKLPEFEDEETLRTKLLYAVESGAGFELS